MRILIVEDEEKIANSLKSGLTQESYAVDVVNDGKEGYEMASYEDYDVIILDLMLPSMDGIAICESLRKDKITTPILMLSARNETADKIQGLDVGADDYLSKPFSFEELLARVRALSRRPRPSTGTILEVEDLTLNTVTSEVSRGGKVLSLSGKEFALLEYLMRHKGTIVKKDQIISHVWDYDADVLPNSVEVYITHLRGKVDKPFKEKNLITTVRGFGYKIG